MKKFYFTFGIGQSLLANRFVKIAAESYDEAREILVESFGTKWAFQYPEEEWREKNIEQKYNLVELNVNEFWR